MNANYASSLSAMFFLFPISDIKRKNIPILLLANKMDLRESQTAERVSLPLSMITCTETFGCNFELSTQCAALLKLDELTDKAYHIW